jgi:hypothetical protein
MSVHILNDFLHKVLLNYRISQQEIVVKRILNIDGRLRMMLPGRPRENN